MQQELQAALRELNRVEEAAAPPMMANLPAHMLAPIITECSGGGYMITIDGYLAARTTLQEAFEYAAMFAKGKFTQELETEHKRWWKIWRK